jgi:hypothetical protein
MQALHEVVTWWQLANHMSNLQIYKLQILLVKRPILFSVEICVFNSLGTDGDFCHQGRDTEIAKKCNIVRTYWHGHSLESTWGALSDGTINFSIQPFFGENAISIFFSKNLSP